jgi:hypothetical protein
MLVLREVFMRIYLVMLIVALAASCGVGPAGELMVYVEEESTEVEDVGVLIPLVEEDSGVASSDSGVEPIGVDGGALEDSGLQDAGTEVDSGSLFDDAGTDDAGTDDAGTDDAGTDDAGTEVDSGPPLEPCPYRCGSDCADWDAEELPGYQCALGGLCCDTGVPNYCDYRVIGTTTRTWHEPTNLCWDRSFFTATLSEALATCAENGEGWRVPTITELRKVVDYYSGCDDLMFSQGECLVSEQCTDYECLVEEDCDCDALNPMGYCHYADSAPALLGDCVWYSDGSMTPVTTLLTDYVWTLDFRYGTVEPVNSLTEVLQWHCVRSGPI